MVKEGHVWSMIEGLLETVDGNPPRCVYSDRVILRVTLWAVIHDRPMSWACRVDNWPEASRPSPMPNGSTLSRRWKRSALTRKAEAVHLESVRRLGPIRRYAAIDGRPLPVGGFSKDPDARRGQADWAEIGLFGTLAGVICVIGAIGWCVGSATVIGLVQSWRCRRNLLPASMRVSAYLAGYLVLWAALGGAMIDLWIMMDRSDFFRQIGRPVGINGDFLGVITWLIPQIGCALGHWTLLFRGTSVARYANR